MNLFKIVKVFFKNILLSRHAHPITNNLDTIREGISDLNRLIDEVTNSVVLIPDDYIQNVKAERGDLLNYLESNSVYSFNEKLANYMSKLTLDEKPERFLQFESSFKDLKDNYYSLLITLANEIIVVNKKLDRYYEGLKSFNNDIEQLRKQFIAHSDMLELRNRYEFMYSFFQDSPVDSEIQQFLHTYTGISDLVKVWNTDFISKELSEMEHFLDNIDGKSLDEQQRKAVIVDEDANLVVAGAGAGKTLTISGKVKYLVERKGVSPEEILLLSFTRKAADEMAERIQKRLKINVDVKTFHQLGSNIIASALKIKPDVIEDPRSLIKPYFNKEMYDNPSQIKRVIEFFGYYLNIPKDIAEFKTLGEYYNNQKTMDLETLKSKYGKDYFINRNVKRLKGTTTTLQGERMKSLEEVMIANFLFLNGINYVYEGDYKYPTANENYRKYKPDFYLPDFDIYIEHFGITKDGRTPWLSEVEEKKYIDGVHWKRQLHKQKGTTLIETYSYLNSNGQLLDFLQKELLSHQVKFIEVDYIDIFNKIYDVANKNHFDEFIKFVSSFISLFKSNGFDEDKFEDFLNVIDKSNLFLYNRTKTFLEITKPVFEYYNKELEKTDRIDFNDMINDATSIIRDGGLNVSYKYIIIDEYQDISVSRFNLIKEIREQTQAKILCVGDDWQSIYRFAGSDLNLFTQFEQYFGYSELLKIEKTYRNSQQLINHAGQFIMRNSQQLSKNLRSDKQNEDPLNIFTYNSKNGKIKTLKGIIDSIVTVDGNSCEIMLIGRNNGDIRFIEEELDFSVKKKNKDTKIIYHKYPNLNLNFLTAHRSKGLEADNVIIINAENSLYGFPNRIADDPILSLVLTAQEDFPYAEERRLFYVALTRTKNFTCILALDKKVSPFVTELNQKHGIQFKSKEGNTTIVNNPSCPKCIEGYLEIRNNKFLGCSNFPSCDYTLNNLKVINNPIQCPVCKGYMVERKGSRGKFYGCSNYPICRHTRELQEVKKVGPDEHYYKEINESFNRLVNDHIHKVEKINDEIIDNKSLYKSQKVIDSKGVTASNNKRNSSEITLSTSSKREIKKYLKTVSSAREISELLINHHGVSAERYTHGKPKVYPQVCMYLDDLVAKGIVELNNKQGIEDRFYTLK